MAVSGWILGFMTLTLAILVAWVISALLRQEDDLPKDAVPHETEEASTDGKTRTSEEDVMKRANFSLSTFDRLQNDRVRYHNILQYRPHVPPCHTMPAPVTGHCENHGETLETASLPLLHNPLRTSWVQFQNSTLRKPRYVPHA